jgi:hypothetical protein
MSKLYIDIDVSRAGYQLSISTEAGSGYRLAGPKYDGSSKSIMRHALSERDVVELRQMLDKAYPANSVAIERSNE